MIYSILDTFSDLTKNSASVGLIGPGLTENSMCDSEASTRPENWEPKMRGPRSFEGRDSPKCPKGHLSEMVLHRFRNLMLTQTNDPSDK